MRIGRVTAYVIKSPIRYELAGQTKPTHRLPGTDYFQFPPYPQLYSERSESMIVKIDTDEGISGWGEAQAPIGPEITQAIVQRVLGPVLLGADPLATSVRYSEMYETLRVRGQTGGFQLDAIAALDTALWDIRGKAVGKPVSELLGGRFRERLPCYVTGLRERTLDGRAEEAQRWRDVGIAGVKPCLGFGVASDAAEIERLRDAVGDNFRLFVDGVWKYTVPEAVRVARAFERSGVEFFESPLLPENVDGHARLVRSLDLAIAVGEPLRGRFQFLQWIKAGALDLAQPDTMRNGITETYRIAALCEVHGIPVAIHNGMLTVIGMAATWQTAAAISNFFIQEYQPVMLDTFNAWLTEPLRLDDGELVVPQGPGLGIEIDEERFAQDVQTHVALEAD